MPLYPLIAFRKAEATCKSLKETAKDTPAAVKALQEEDVARKALAEAAKEQKAALKTLKKAKKDSKELAIAVNKAQGAVQKAKNTGQAASATASEATNATHIADKKEAVVQTEQAASTTASEANAAKAALQEGIIVTEGANAIQVGEYTFLNSAAQHYNKTVIHGKNAGQLSRPFMRSPLMIEEILATGKGVPDATAIGALNFKVAGTFRGSEGIWELVIDIDKKLIYHFNFKGV